VYIYYSAPNNHRFLPKGIEKNVFVIEPTMLRVTLKEKMDEQMWVSKVEKKLTKLMLMILHIPA